MSIILKQGESIPVMHNTQKTIAMLEQMIGEHKTIEANLKTTNDEAIAKQRKLRSEFVAKVLAPYENGDNLIVIYNTSTRIENIKQTNEKLDDYVACLNKLFDRKAIKVARIIQKNAINKIQETVYVRFDNKEKGFKYDAAEPGNSFLKFVEKMLDEKWVHVEIEVKTITTSVDNLASVIRRLKCVDNDTFPQGSILVPFEFQYLATKVNIWEYDLP